MSATTTLDIQTIRGAHEKWLRGEEDGIRADLSGADLRGADLNSADLRDANLRGADLSGADLRGANLRGADLSDANLRGPDLNSSDLSGANLRGANLRSADLSGANLRGANLRSADLSDANLRGADLSDANLRGANLRGADLSGANLSQAKGVLDPIDYIAQHFERDLEGRGIIAYKTFNAYYKAPPAWKIEAGAVLTEVVNFNRCYDCASGVNVATREWIAKNSEANSPIWRVLIRWEWLIGVCVPYHTDGKIRCSRVELL